MKRLVAVAVLAMLASPATMARAEKQGDPAGTWTWQVPGTSANQTVTLKLKREGEKLTGVLNRNGRDTNIEDGKISRDEVSFTVTPARKGAKFPVKYTGKVTGENIIGTMEMTIDGQPRTVPWKAWRSKE